MAMQAGIVLILHLHTNRRSELHNAGELFVVRVEDRPSHEDMPPDFSFAFLKPAAPIVETPTFKMIIFSGAIHAAPGGPGSIAALPPRPDPQAPNPMPYFPTNLGLSAANEHLLVVLRLQVLETGKIGRAVIENSSGLPQLDALAITFVKRWHFIPAMIAGVPKPDWISVEVLFKSH
jgi:TonB family protein